MTMNELKFTWKGDPEDMEGIATFTLPTGIVIELWFHRFSAANAAHERPQEAFAHVRHEARKSLLGEIGRIEP